MLVLFPSNSLSFDFNSSFTSHSSPLAWRSSSLSFSNCAYALFNSSLVSTIKISRSATSFCATVIILSFSISAFVLSLNFPFASSISVSKNEICFLRISDRVRSCFRKSDTSSISASVYTSSGLSFKGAELSPQINRRLSTSFSSPSIVSLWWAIAASRSKTSPSFSETVSRKHLYTSWSSLYFSKASSNFRSLSTTSSLAFFNSSSKLSLPSSILNSIS